MVQPGSDFRHPPMSAPPITRPPAPRRVTLHCTMVRRVQNQHYKTYLDSQPCQGARFSWPGLRVPTRKRMRRRRVLTRPRKAAQQLTRDTSLRPTGYEIACYRIVYRCCVHAVESRRTRCASPNAVVYRPTRSCQDAAPADRSAGLAWHADLAATRGNAAAAHAALVLGQGTLAIVLSEQLGP